MTSRMDCNKEEAIRAKEIAEKKMHNKDYLGARKIALKAQQLYPELDNISQMLTVCDVHCSAEQKFLHSEMDWYGILQVTQTADEASIKKQYRKLALLLHPDKNKFAGAEAAFKLIGEAQRVLTDQQKRSLYDMKCKHSVKVTASRQPPVDRHNFVTKQPPTQNNFTNAASQPFSGPNMHQKQNQPCFPNGEQTFWTLCPFCGIRYQYYRNVLNRALRCQSCTKPFIAYDMDAQGPAGGANQGQFASAQQKEVFGQGVKVGSQGAVGNPPGVGLQKTFGTGTQGKQHLSKTGSSSDAGEQGKARPKNQEKSEDLKPVGNKDKKRRRELDEESSESFDTGSSSDMEEDGSHPTGQNPGFTGGHYPRRSSRQKHNVTYKEDASDDDDFSSPPKQPRAGGSFHATEDNNKDAAASGGLPNDVKMENPLEENLPNEREKTEAFKENGKEADVMGDNEGSSKLDSDSKKSNESPETMPDPEYYVYPDPDFSNFDQLREPEKFEVDQIWALYDTSDAMPRFYARVRKVYSPGFRIRITWLEPVPCGEEEIAWVNEDLPFSSGNFKNGKTEDTEDQLMFSHVITYETGNRRASYKIYPRKGETWALFKDWDIKWNSNPGDHQKYEYEYVEVVSEYSEDSGISVVYLGKMKGFVSLFRQITKEGIHTFQIPPNELLRFSHRIPSFRMTGGERDDVPEGSYELDPASLPTDVEVFSHTEDVKLDNGSKGSCSNFSEENAKPMESRFPDKQKSSLDLNEENGLETKKSGNSYHNPVELNETLKKPSQANASQCADEEKTSKQQNKVKNGSIGDSTEAGVSTYQNDEERHLVVDDTSSDDISENPTSTPASPSEPDEIPETEFCDFAIHRSPQKLKIGQIWALYGDHDAMPKFYGKIKRIRHAPDFMVYITWLEACPLPMDSIKWINRDMPIGCGVFMLGDETEFETTCSFSHRLEAELAGKNRYSIYPRKGEVWALYKNWDAKWTISNLPDCKYDVVEILEHNSSGTKVQFLVLVDGYKTVYKAAKKKGSAIASQIPQRELLKFSHQVPAFRLTEEKNGSLSGCWELDPASLPCT